MAGEQWHMILSLKRAVLNYRDRFSFCHVQTDGLTAFDRLLPARQEIGDIVVRWPDVLPPRLPEDALHFELQNKMEIGVVANGNFSPAQIEFFRLYLPYCFLPLYAETEKRALTIAHFAQSLDGRIATLNGDSKWIGNQENLIHAHRMRALCDAILIGSGTLRADQPRLTVRHVAGENPVRVVLGNSCRDFSSLTRSGSGRIMVIGPEGCSLNGQVEYIEMAPEGRFIPCRNILRQLYERGISSVYLEGGARTTSNFLKEKAVDILQLHLSPLIFGSGRPAVELPAITSVQEALQFDRFHFQKVGDTMMFLGLPDH